MNDDDIKKLLPDLALWNNGGGITLSSWVSGIGRYDHAIGYLAVFWPNFVMHNGCICRTPPDSKTFDDWMRSCQGNRTTVEAMMNHVHLLDLFPNSPFTPTREVIHYLGITLKEMWSCKLARDYPGLPIEVKFSYEDVGDLLGYEVTVFQNRND